MQYASLQGAFRARSHDEQTCVQSLHALREKVVSCSHDHDRRLDRELTFKTRARDHDFSAGNFHKTHAFGFRDQRRLSVLRSGEMEAMVVVSVLSEALKSCQLKSCARIEHHVFLQAVVYVVLILLRSQGIYVVCAWLGVVCQWVIKKGPGNSPTRLIDCACTEIRRTMNDMAQ